MQGLYRDKGYNYLLQVLGSAISEGLGFQGLEKSSLNFMLS